MVVDLLNLGWIFGGDGIWVGVAFGSGCVVGGGWDLGWGGL